jgi:hypothetical protein
MRSSFEREWRRTGKGARVFLCCWSALFVLAYVIATIWQAKNGRYADAAAELLMFGLLFLWKAVWPFYIAAAARKRGGDFGGWLTGGIILGFWIIGLIYLLRWSHKPILAEYATEESAAI